MLNWKRIRSKSETRNRFGKYRDKIIKLDTLSPNFYLVEEFNRKN